MLLTLSENSDHLYFSFDMEKGEFTYLNRAFRLFFNLADGAVNPADILPLVHPDDKAYLQDKLRECLTGRSVKNTECRFTLNGNMFWLRLEALHEAGPNGRYLMGFAEDVTNFKSQNDVLNIHNNKIDAILNILAHELVGPIGNIQNLAILLSREISADDNPQVEQYIHLISKISKSCISLIRDFLNEEFLESAGAKLIKRRVDLVARVRLHLQEYLSMQDGLNINFSCTANTEVVYIEIDEDKFLQVINNLISNALKFTPDGGTISVNVEEKEDTVLISVADTGIGIPEKYQATLFDKFSDARRNGLRGEPSVGLGMFIIKTIVEWHQGSIWFNSELNKGTTFFIEIPK